MAPKEQVISAESRDLAPSLENPPASVARQWLERKRSIDKIEPDLWRIGDGLYRLDDYANRHPGGKDWIRTTKGTDITELFEVSHVFGNENKLGILKKYFVKPANHPRASYFTFKPEGFYMTLKRRAQQVFRQVGTGPSVLSLLIQDGLMISFHLLLGLGIYFSSTPLLIMAGLSLGMVMSSSHNFWHQSDNFRRFYFDITVASSDDSRVTHMLSHHIHTNTFHDIESTALFPIMDVFPHMDKLWWHRFISPLTYHLGMLIVAPIAFAVKMADLGSGQAKAKLQDFIPLLHFFLIWKFSDWSLMMSLMNWTMMHCLSTYWLIITPLLSTHHHPSSYHAGDTPYQDTDWGLHQLDANRDVKSENLFVIATTLKNHTLHHLFPTVDHSKLPLVYPVFEQTCREFGVDFQYESVWQMILGFHYQLMRLKPQSYEERAKLKAQQSKKRT